MALSDMAARNAKATGKAYTGSDIDGLSLVVSPTGGKTWHYRYYWAGKQKRVSLCIWRWLSTSLPVTSWAGQ